MICIASTVVSRSQMMQNSALNAENRFQTYPLSVIPFTIPTQLKLIGRQRKRSLAVLFPFYYSSF